MPGLADLPEHGSPVTLRSGSSTVQIYPGIGGRLGQLDLGGGPLLRGPSRVLGWAHWGCYPLVPWSNRVPGGRLTVGDLHSELDVNWPDGSSIHGLGASCPWQLRAVSDAAADLEVKLAGGPYRIHGALSYALEPGRLSLRLRARNDGDWAVPVGIGIHPWFRQGRVSIAADARWPGEPLPTGPPEPVEGSFDLRHGAVPVPMDVCFTALTASVAEVPGARLHWDGPITNVVVYSGEPGWVCVEPVTMANDGFGLARRGVPGHGVRHLKPGRSVEVTYRFEDDQTRPRPRAE